MKPQYFTVEATIENPKSFCIAEFLPLSFMTSLLFGSSERFYQQQMYVFFRSLIQMFKLLAAQPCGTTEFITMFTITL